MKFSESLWLHIAPVYQKIIFHPFNTELSQGTLDMNRFTFYLKQDSYYLMLFSKALAYIAGRASTSQTIHRFLNFAIDALEAERTLHAQFLLSSYQCDHIQPSFATLAYTQYIIATCATASLEEAIASILPCFWIYREVGRNMSRNKVENNRYQPWIETYSSQEFSEGTDQAITILDEIANQSSTHTLQSMHQVFEYCSWFEWYFWEDAYNMNVFRKVKEPCIKNLLTLH